jgi:hypothetical protein
MGLPDLVAGVCGAPHEPTRSTYSSSLPEWERMLTALSGAYARLRIPLFRTIGINGLGPFKHLHVAYGFIVSSFNLAHC